MVYQRHEEADCWVGYSPFGEGIMTGKGFVPFRCSVGNAVAMWTVAVWAYVFLMHRASRACEWCRMRLTAGTSGYVRGVRAVCWTCECS